MKYFWLECWTVERSGIQHLVLARRFFSTSSATTNKRGLFRSHNVVFQKIHYELLAKPGKVKVKRNTLNTNLFHILLYTIDLKRNGVVPVQKFLKNK